VGPVEVVAAVGERDGRYLITRRLDGTHLAGLWEFPGGKIEPGETPEDALIRELEEELAIMVPHACLAPAVFASAPLGDRHLLLLLFVTRKWTGVPRALEADALRWVYPRDMHDLPMPPADKPLIGLLDALL
jgi:8-oxo-dGTP diphosphatase